MEEEYKREFILININAKMKYNMGVGSAESKQCFWRKRIVRERRFQLRNLKSNDEAS